MFLKNYFHFYIREMMNGTASNNALICSSPLYLVYLYYPPPLKIVEL